MIDGEVALLEAVRDTIRGKLQLSEVECDCEYDEQIPAIAKDRYVAVIPAGCDPGPNHQRAAGVHDSLHAVQVMVLIRSTAVPRDRRRSIFLNQLSGINQLLTQIIKVLDWQMDLFSLSNHYMEQQVPGSDPFTELLRLTRVDSKPRMVSTETYDSSKVSLNGTTPYTAMARSAYFGRCRRMQNVVQTPPIHRSV
ncbi:MAG: hypothetical protein ACK5YR_19050 [Pirellula sp.]|jgi:hypothetical protein